MISVEDSKGEALQQAGSEICAAPWCFPSVHLLSFVHCYYGFNHNQTKDSNLDLQNFQILFSFPCIMRAKSVKYFHRNRIMLKYFVLNESVYKPWQVRQRFGTGRCSPWDWNTVYLHPSHPTPRSSWKRQEGTWSLVCNISFQCCNP